MVRLTAIGCSLLVCQNCLSAGFPYSWVSIETNNYHLVRQETEMVGYVIDDMSCMWKGSYLNRYEGTLGFRFASGPGTFRMAYYPPTQGSGFPADQQVSISAFNDGTNVISEASLWYDKIWLFTCRFDDPGEHVVELRQSFCRTYVNPTVKYACGVRIVQLTWLPDSVMTVANGKRIDIPRAWIDSHVGEATLSAHGGDYTQIPGLIGANGCRILESYVAGLDPLNEKSRLTAKIEFIDGKPNVTHEPPLEDAEAAKRIYSVYGKKTLSDDEPWVPVTDVGKSACRFFKVAVEMRQ